MLKINMTCDHCKKVIVCERTSDIPDSVTELFCNWCSPDCEDEVRDYYHERFGFDPVPSINNEA